MPRPLRNPKTYGVPQNGREFGVVYQADDSADVGIPPPTAPSNAAASQVEKRTNRITWDDNSDDETEFRIEVSTGGAFSTLTSVDPDEETYDHTNVTIGTEYTYRIIAVGAGGDSAPATASPITPTYRYGYPAFGSAASSGTPIFQLTFEAASGNLTERVEEEEFTAVSSPVYGTTAAGVWANVSPGITFDTTNDRFDDAAWGGEDIGTSDFTVEFVFKTSELDAVFNNIINLQDSGGNDQLWFSWRADTEVLLVRFDGVSYNISVDEETIADGEVHKGKLLFDRSANLVFELDGSPQGTPQDISASVASDIKCDKITVGNFVGGGGVFLGTLFEIRISKNLTSDSGGPDPD